MIKAINWGTRYKLLVYEKRVKCLNSWKCWQCQQHWQRASDNADNDSDRIRNEQIEMACFLYTRSVKSGKVSFLNYIRTLFLCCKENTLLIIYFSSSQWMVVTMIHVTWARSMMVLIMPGIKIQRLLKISHFIMKSKIPIRMLTSVMWRHDDVIRGHVT